MKSGQKFSFYGSIQELKSYSKVEKYFLLFSGLVGFLILFDYGFVRPVSEGLFNAHYPPKEFRNALPYAWLIIIPVSFLASYIYYKFLPKFGYLKMFITFAISVLLINTLFGFTAQNVNYNKYHISFILFIWKDIYIMLALSQLWSVINSTISFKRAKYLYGLFFLMGGIGSLLGNKLVLWLPKEMPSSDKLFLSAPCYLLIGIFIALASRIGKKIDRKEDLEKLSEDKNYIKSDGLKLVLKSPLLPFILILVCFMQFGTALTDYQFKWVLGESIKEVDKLSNYYAHLLFIVNLFSIFIQLVGGFLLLHFIGLKWSHLSIPILFLINAILFGSAQIFKQSFVSEGMLLSIISISFCSIKAVDYSLFNIVKEVLYIPVRLDEKFKAKSVIDVFAYRSIKALAGVIIIVVKPLAAGVVMGIISSILVVTYILWIIVVPIMYKRFEHEL